MLRLLTALAVVVLVTAAASGQQPIRLVVIVVLDQFRADYLTTFASHWRDGFRTLLAEGAVFTRAAYPYLHTDTCAGHFTIGTGTFPRTHGMVSDLDRKSTRLNSSHSQISYAVFCLKKKKKKREHIKKI